ncbi:GAF domain-containing protein [Hymenobacter caeli]|uniref:Methionine-R-sulfoxide reductase with GAF domain n=1 Tax=Hymenobacter caeli TaxID=2735894 RepID=A0ABX2FPI3_9BACT|nr:GAF domain-containing protein [Hymenobacter caeli]NRT18456.1 putative methionine-R-sulfoxide reductase with GAF domain [Hymenobacter caeli]
MAIAHLASLPLAEELRLQALRPYQLLNTMQDETFTELVRLSAKLFNVPIGIVAFVEEEEVSLGLNHGLEPGLDRVSRGETLCSVALLNEGTTVFENLHDHPCDLVSPMLVQRLRLGFYAGRTLRTAAGYPIGVLCVIGHKPRSFSEAEAGLLERLAAVVMSLLDLRLHLQQQPTWNQRLWEAIYARIDSSVTRLETLAALASWEEEDGPTAQSYQDSAREESLRIIAVLTEQIRALRA